MAASGTRLPNPMRQECPQLAKADVYVLTSGSGFDQNQTHRSFHLTSYILGWPIRL
jgi:hypothetical protein